ncbi:putative ribonuclease H-like domain-containing protein, partial [Tanacetum coccineum]
QSRDLITGSCLDSSGDYGGASLDRKSTTGGCQFLGRRLISWQCKKQTIAANSTTEAEYVAAANCYGSLGFKESLERDMDEAIYRSDSSLFDDADGIDSLTNQAIFDNIQLMGNQLKDVHVPLDHFPVPTLTKKVLTFMVKKGKNFSGKVTPLFDSMLVQQTEDEGDASERPSDSPPIPSPPHPSEDQPQIQPDPSPRPSPTTHIPDSIPEGSGGNHGGQSSNDASLSGNEDGLTLQSVYDLCVSLCKQVTAQAKEIKALKAQVKKLKKGVKPLITHHKAWMKTRLARKTSLKKKGVHKEYVSKQGRKSVKTFKGEPSVHKDPAFDDLDDFVDVDDTLDYMETEDDQNEGRTSSVVLEEKESANKEVSTEGPISTDKQNEARLNADKMLAEKLQEEDREMYTIEQRTKFLHDTIASQRRFLAQ